jgi:hypothetical protein
MADIRCKHPGCGATDARDPDEHLIKYGHTPVYDD